MDIRLKYSTDYPMATHKWVLIVDGVKHIVNTIEINCKSQTAEDGSIVCRAKKLSFSTKKDIKKAIIA